MVHNGYPRLETACPNRFRGLSPGKPYDKDIEKKTQNGENERKRRNLATRPMIKERRGRIIVVAGSSASFIDNDSVDKRLSRLSALTPFDT